MQERQSPTRNPYMRQQTESALLRANKIAAVFLGVAVLFVLPNYFDAPVPTHHGICCCYTEPSYVSPTTLLLAELGAVLTVIAPLVLSTGTGSTRTSRSSSTNDPQGFRFHLSTALTVMITAGAGLGIVMGNVGSNTVAVSCCCIAVVILASSTCELHARSANRAASRKNVRKSMLPSS